MCQIARRSFASLLLLAAVGNAACGQLPLHARRASADDLEVAGELAGLPSGSHRYLRYKELLGLPQVNAQVEQGDAFRKSVQVSGVPLDLLSKALAADGKALLVAICSDEYRSHYTMDYLTAHHPILVLKINGVAPDQWSQFAPGEQLGPYLVANPHFTPAFRILSHQDQPQNPYGVVRLEVHDQERFLAPLLPAIPHTETSAAFLGYRVAQQNCLRCHNQEQEGGRKAGRSWLQLAAWAASNADSFERYVHDPSSVIPCSHMPAQTPYDAPTLGALAAYFRSFLESTSYRAPAAK